MAKVGGSAKWRVVLVASRRRRLGLDEYTFRPFGVEESGEVL